MKKLVLETTAPFQGLPELVAYEEGLFAKEGLAVEWADREQGVEKKVETDVTSPKGVNPFASHGKLFEQGKADMYNACEWGNYCRVQDTSAGSRQLGRRAIVTFSALVVAAGFVLLAQAGQRFFAVDQLRLAALEVVIAAVEHVPRLRQFLEISCKGVLGQLVRCLAGLRRCFLEPPQDILGQVKREGRHRFLR